MSSCSPLTADRQANITSMLEQQADRVMALGEWEERWQQNKIGFHQPEVHKMLKKNIDKVLNGRTGVRFFFPLCGKAVDMKWLADMGHAVVGVEISEKAIRQFFEENNMTYSEEPVPAIPGAKVYKNSEKNISLYQCNLYNFSNSIEGQFGAIWDRASLVAVNPGDREKYAALIISLMANDCRYLLDTLLYNHDLYQGILYHFYIVCHAQEIKSLYHNDFNKALLFYGGNITNYRRSLIGNKKGGSHQQCETEVLTRA
uniref:thiopurine S-methyltransferase n=1 Tax=Haplochromis burtoni TaxID=8153 RepID=A0A3Q2XHN6_HAPBU